MSRKQAQQIDKLEKVVSGQVVDDIPPEETLVHIDVAKLELKQRAAATKVIIQAAAKAKATAAKAKATAAKAEATAAKAKSKGGRCKVHVSGGADAGYVD